jgi:hypothetical protein
VIAGPARGADRRRRRGQPRREHHRRGAAFERGEQALGVHRRRRLVARVARTAQLVGGVTRERGRELDRRHERAGGVLGVDRARDERRELHGALPRPVPSPCSSGGSKKP